MLWVGFGSSVPALSTPARHRKSTTEIPRDSKRRRRVDGETGSAMVVGRWRSTDYRASDHHRAGRAREGRPPRSAVLCSARAAWSNPGPSTGLEEPPDADRLSPRIPGLPERRDHPRLSPARAQLRRGVPRVHAGRRAGGVPVGPCPLPGRGGDLLLEAAARPGGLGPRTGVRASGLPADRDRSRPARVPRGARGQAAPVHAAAAASGLNARGDMPRMRAAQVRAAKGPFEVVEREIPDPGPGSVRIKVQASGICHSDSLTKEGLWPGLRYPRVPGHEVAGIVDAVGAGVAGWNVGDRGGVGWHGGHCGHCDACRHGDFLVCQVAALVPGISYDGGHADYMIAPAVALARIPEGLSAADAAP